MSHPRQWPEGLNPVAYPRLTTVVRRLLTGYTECRHIQGEQVLRFSFEEMPEISIYCTYSHKNAIKILFTTTASNRGIKENANKYRTRNMRRVVPATRTRTASRPASDLPINRPHFATRAQRALRPHKLGVDTAEAATDLAATPGYGLRATGYGLRATGYGLRATGYGLRAVSGER